MTLGVTDITGYAAANINGSAGADARTRLFTAGASESIGSLEFYFDSTYDGDAIVKLFIANASGTILGITGVVTATASGGTRWCGGSITPVSVVSGQNYYLGMYIAPTSCNGSGRAGVYRAGGSPTDSYLDSTSGTYTTPPSALSSLSSTSAYSSIAIRGSTAAVIAPTISSAAPSGTLGTSTTATVGATTNQNTGTLYAVIASSSASLSGITATQIKAGQLASGSAAPFSGNAAVSTTSPSVGITGLTGNTTYYYAIVQNNSNGDSNVINTGSFTTANPAAVLSSGTPSGTLGTQTTASVGATTTQNSGTLYAILSTVSGDVTGATAANIKAGQKAGGSAAPFSGNAAVATTSPSVAITGLTAGTLYYFAIIQNNGNGDSNIINTGSFTTAAATSSFSIPIKSAAGVLLSGVTLRFWTRLTEDGAAVDGGSAGIPIICGSDGVFAISTLTIAKGAGFLYWSNPADPYKRHYIPYTFY